MRRRLIVLTVLAISMVSWNGAAAQTATAVQTARSYTASNFILELDGQQVGPVFSSEGGSAFGNVVKEEAGEDYFVKKHLGFPGVHDIHFEIGPGMESPVYDWIDQSLRGKASPMNGAVLTADARGTILSRLEFTRAQITEVTFPGMDGASKEVVRILIGLTPEQTFVNRKPGGTIAKVNQKRQQNVLGANFKLSIDGVNTTRVSKIDALTVRLPFRSSSQGECLHCEGIQAPPPIDFPNLVITMAQTGAESMEAWFQNFVINGESGDSAEKGGELAYLTPNLQTALFTIKFSHLGIFELASQNGTSDAIARFVAAMYCESFEFSAAPGQ